MIGGTMARPPAGPATTWYVKASIWSTAFLAVAGILPPLFAHFGHHFGGTTSDARFALQWAPWIVALLVWGIGMIAPGWDKGGIVGFVVGYDNRLSTSKLQVALWTIAIVFAFFFFMFQIIHGATEGEELNSLGAGYLLLLGGPFAAAVLAKFTTSTQARDGTLAQTAAVQPSVKDVVTGHDDAPAIADVQFFLFNLTALTYFAIALAKHPAALPVIPDTLVGLTSVSALTYLGAKVVGSSQPAITSIMISQVAAANVGAPLDGHLRANDTLRIIGTGFQPSAALGAIPPPPGAGGAAVLFNGREVSANVLSSTQLEVTVPANLPAGTGVTIQVRTASGALSNVDGTTKAA